MSKKTAQKELNNLLGDTRFIDLAISNLRLNGARQATAYISPTRIVRATLRGGKKKIDKRANVEILLTIGKPNYLERDFIKAAKKAGEPFPIRKVQLKFPRAHK